MLRIFAFVLSLFRLLSPVVRAAYPTAFRRYREKTESKNPLAASRCRQGHKSEGERRHCPRSHVLEERGRRDGDLLIITTIKDDDRYWHKFFETLPAALSDVCFDYALVLESPSQEQLEHAIEATSWMSNISVYAAKRSTIYAAWNLAIQNFNGGFVSNLNVDDLRFAGSYRAQLDRLAREPEAAGVFARFQEFDDWEEGPGVDGSIPLEHEEMSLKHLIFKGKNPMHASPIWKRSLHDELGLFDESMLSSGDTEFWLRSLLAGEEFIRDPEIRYASLNRSDSVSSPTQKVGRLEWAATLDKYSRATLRKLVCPSNE